MCSYLISFRGFCKHSMTIFVVSDVGVGRADGLYCSTPLFAYIMYAKKTAFKLGK